MHYFSGLYKKMCERATEIQEAWELRDWDEYCDKGDQEDGFGEEVHLGILTDGEKEDIKINKVWLPLLYQISERLFRTYGLDSLRKFVESNYSGYLRECLEEKERLQKIREHFIGDAIGDVLGLMFVMERYYGKRWDFDKQDWIEI